MRQLDILSDRRRYRRLAAVIPERAAILLQHRLVDAPMRRAVDVEAK
jgi:hypothetical protein